MAAVRAQRLASLLAPGGRETGRELNPAILSAEEFAARRQGGVHFLEAVLAEPRIWLVGDDAALAALG